MTDEISWGGGPAYEEFGGGSDVSLSLPRQQQRPVQRTSNLTRSTTGLQQQQQKRPRNDSPVSFGTTSTAASYFDSAANDDDDNDNDVDDKAKEPVVEAKSLYAVAPSRKLNLSAAVAANANGIEAQQQSTTSIYSNGTSNEFKSLEEKFARMADIIGDLTEALHEARREIAQIKQRQQN